MCRLRLAILVLAVAACGGNDPSPPDRLLPGPCSASFTSDDSERAFSYTYDASDRLIRVEESTNEVGYYIWTATYVRDETGAIVDIELATVPPRFDGIEGAWHVTATGVDYHYTDEHLDALDEEYEAGLRFLGDPLEAFAAAHPMAPDSILRRTVQEVLGEIEETTFTYDGPPRVGTRTQTPSAGTTATSTYDADGNLLEYRAGTTGYAYRWESGRVVEKTSRTPGGEVVEDYVRDEFGNLLEVTSAEGAHPTTTYDFDCW
jgi:hypothetical protein